MRAPSHTTRIARSDWLIPRDPWPYVLMNRVKVTSAQRIVCIVLFIVFAPSRSIKASCPYMYIVHVVNSCLSYKHERERVVVTKFILKSCPLSVSLFRTILSYVRYYAVHLSLTNCSSTISWSWAGGPLIWLGVRVGANYSAYICMYLLVCDVRVTVGLKTDRLKVQWRKRDNCEPCAAQTSVE